MSAVYIISDLHLGGDPNEPEVPGDRGFQMCKQGELLAQFITKLSERDSAVELVIAGDFVDFLAEHPPGTKTWSAFHREADVAAQILQTIMKDREPEVFKALKAFLCKPVNHRVTLLLGNHDLELALPKVRKVLMEELSASSANFRFVYDNEAYPVADAIIEHGNRVDPVNEVDHDNLRRVRVLQSRLADSLKQASFTPPVGSRIVSTLMNPMKVSYPFIDLLKPEGAAVFPVLLALNPGAFFKLGEFAKQIARAGGHAAVNRAAPRYGMAIAGQENFEGEETFEDLRKLLKTVLSEEEAGQLMEACGFDNQTPYGTDISSLREIERTLEAQVVTRVLRPLLRNDGTFDMSKEESASYKNAAHKHLERGWSYVIFGHTHRALWQTFDDSEGVYINSGTWADLVRVPPEIHDDDLGQATKSCKQFLEDMRAGRLESHVIRRPSYVRLEVEDDRVKYVALCIYKKLPAQNPDPDAADNVVNERRHA